MCVCVCVCENTLSLPRPTAFRHHVQQGKAKVAQDCLVEASEEIAVVDRVCAQQEACFSYFNLVEEASLHPLMEASS